MNKYLATLLLSLCLSNAVSYGSIESVALSGHMLGGLRGIIAEKESSQTPKRRHFDAAANLNIDVQLSEELSGFFQFQTSPGNNGLAQPGPEIELTDIQFIYIPKLSSYTLTIGSFDLPFGQETGRLSNNADTLQNDFLYNSLLYSAFAGPMGTLNTNGVNYTWHSATETIALTLSNGTDESAKNPDGNFLSGFSGHTTRLHPNIKLGTSVVHSSDQWDADSTGFNTLFNGTMVDVSYKRNALRVDAAIAQLDYQDRNTATDDRVQHLQLGATWNTPFWHVAGRVSQWAPNDSNGSGNTSAIPNPGFGRKENGAPLDVTDQIVIRYQLAHAYHVNPDIVCKTELTYDSYAKTTSDTWGISSMINVAF